jgi:Domain of unknown function (DUF4384)
MRKPSYTNLIWTVLPLVCAWSQDQPYISARKLFYATAEKPFGTARKKGDGKNSVTTVKTGVTVPALRYSVLQEIEPGKETAVESSREFHSGDRIRLEFESNQEGYLYVVQQGSSGVWHVLFPDARINNGTNHVRARTPYSVPAPPKYFVFNDVPGNEKLMVFLCKAPLRGLPSDARSTPEPVEQNIINELNSSIPSRDLVFEKDDDPVRPAVVAVPTAATVSTGTSTYVVNKNENGQAVVATINLKHVQ